MNNANSPLNQPTTTGRPSLQVTLTPIKSAIRADGRTDLDVLLRVQAPTGPAVAAKRLPLTLALVIDRSGSMAGGKLDAAKACVLDLVRQLKPEDEVGVIIYDEQVDVLMPLAGAASAQQQLPALLASAEERGSTDLHAGWLAGAQQVAARTGLNRICRVILLSDGQANHGEVSPQRICEQVRQLAQAGVSTTTVGLGTGFNERLMSAIALAGQGSALYGERPEDLAGPFESELSLLSHLGWRDVRVVAGSATSRWKQRNEYPKAADGALILPSIAVDSEAWAVFSVPMESAARAQLNSQQGKALHVTVRARDVDGVEHVVKASLAALPLMNAEAWGHLPADPLVSRRVAEVTAAQLQMRAQAAVDKGDWDEAERLLEKVDALAADHPWLRSVLEQVRELVKQRDALRAGKELMFASVSMSNRLVSAHEDHAFDPSEEASLASHLRRKVSQGRSTPG